MIAARVHAFGPPEAIRVEPVPRPQPGAGEVLVRVHAAGVGPWDGWIRAGKSVLPQPLPLTLGSDLAGTVEALGPGVTGFAVGDAIYGVTNPRFCGAYAEYAVADAGMIARKPAGLDWVAAASVPVVAVTAWQALFEQGGLAAGQSVLIHGGAGAVGAYAVQLARRPGVRVIATASAGDLDHVRALGADQAIDHRAERFEDVAGPVDLVLDTVGGETLDRSFAVVKPGGMLVSIVAEPDADKARAAGIRAAFMLVKVNGADLDRIAERITAGQLKTAVGVVLPLAEARAAHEMLEGTRPRPPGKIVLQVAD
jgi:NADPH:quinone reductase-like Zn-dependent oxidoreductase